MSTQPTQNRHEEAYVHLMRGVRELDLRGPHVPSDLVLIGDHAFPLAMNSQGQVVMAASLYGCGRIVVLGHEGYLTAFPDLVENALNWLGGDGPDSSSVAVHQQVKAAADNLSKSKFHVEVVGGFSRNPGVGVYVSDAYSVAADAKDLVAFVKAGGGVLLGGQAWSWAQTCPRDNVLHLFEGNKVSGVAGIYFTERRAEAECLPVHPQIPSSWMSVVWASYLFIFTEIRMIYHKTETNQECIVSDLLCNFRHFISLHSESEKTLRMTWISCCRGSRNLRFRVHCWLRRLWSTAPWPSPLVRPAMDKRSWLGLTTDKDELLWSHTRRWWEERCGFNYASHLWKQWYL